MSEKLSGVSIVIPAYNEAAAMGPTLAALQQTLSRLNRPAEILIVDDGSSDDSAQQAKAAGAKVIQHPTNGGYGRSLLTGIEHASYDIVAIMDADGTYPVERLPDLLTFFDKGFDMVVGARQGKNYMTSWSKSFLRFIFRNLAEYTCGRSIPDINSGFRVFYRNPVLAWRPSLSTGFSFTTTITLLFMLNNLFVGYLPIDYHKRAGNSKVRLFRDSFRSLQIIFTAIAQYNPLKLYLLLILIDIAGAFMFVALTIQRIIFNPFTASFFIFGLNALCLLSAIAILAVASIKPVRNPSEGWVRPRRLEI